MDISQHPQESLNKSAIRVAGKRRQKHFHSDLSLWTLIVSNLIVIVWALIEGWPLAIVVWVYWAQSVSIGILWFFKILTLKEFSAKGFTINGMADEETTDTKIRTAFFFLAHYGFFHFVYAFFLFVLFRPVRIGPILFMAVLFLVYQCFSFFYNRKWEGKRKPNIGKMMLFPYARIIPMHITILFGGILSSWGTFAGKMTLALFMLLKSFADVIMHVVETEGFGDDPGESEDQDS
ncbi:MAG: DUF6498-containing protein [Phycisphaerae bacterium]|nr:DUF6498-containing protein [Phycisphaerae bacterium]